LGGAISNAGSQIKRPQIAECQHRLHRTTVRKEQLTDLLRDYDLAEKNYDDLYATKTQSARATDVLLNARAVMFLGADENGAVSISCRHRDFTQRAGSPRTSLRGTIPNPGRVEAAMRPLWRCGAPSAMLHVT
jgi:hypothetical protein